MTSNQTESPIERLFLAISPRLVVVHGPLTGQTFYLNEPVVSVGRLGSNDVCVEDPFVSRHHCIIRSEDDEYLVEDLHSANGTYLNGKRVNAGSLKEGCLMAIGNSQFLFTLQNPEESVTLPQDLVGAESSLSLLDELKAA